MLPDAPSIRPHAGSVRTRADRKQVSVLVVNGGLSSAKLDSDMYLRTTPMEMRRRASLQRARHPRHLLCAQVQRQCCGRGTLSRLTCLLTHLARVSLHSYVLAACCCIRHVSRLHAVQDMQRVRACKLGPGDGEYAGEGWQLNAAHIVLKPDLRRRRPCLCRPSHWQGCGSRGASTAGGLEDTDACGRHVRRWSRVSSVRGASTVRSANRESPKPCSYPCRSDWAHAYGHSSRIYNPGGASCPQLRFSLRFALRVRTHFSISGDEATRACMPWWVCPQAVRRCSAS